MENTRSTHDVILKRPLTTERAQGCSSSPFNATSTYRNGLPKPISGLLTVKSALFRWIVSESENHALVELGDSARTIHPPQRRCLVENVKAFRLQWIQICINSGSYRRKNPSDPSRRTIRAKIQNLWTEVNVFLIGYKMRAQASLN